MSWRYREPQRSHYDTEEEYEEACDNYWEAVDNYCDSLDDDRCQWYSLKGKAPCQHVENVKSRQMAVRFRLPLPGIQERMNGMLEMFMVYIGAAVHALGRVTGGNVCKTATY